MGTYRYVFHYGFLSDAGVFIKTVLAIKSFYYTLFCPELLVLLMVSQWNSFKRIMFLTDHLMWGILLQMQ